MSQANSNRPYGFAPYGRLLFYICDYELKFVANNIVLFYICLAGVLQCALQSNAEYIQTTMSDSLPPMSFRLADPHYGYAHLLQERQDVVGRCLHE